MNHITESSIERSSNLVGKKFMEFFLPSVLMAASISLSLIIDSIIVGNVLGSKALAAMNLIVPISLCFTAISAMFGIGSATCIPMFKGKMDGKNADKCLTLSCLAWALCSIAGILAGMFSFRTIAAFLAGSSGLTDLVAEYLRVYLLGSPFTFITLIFPYIIKIDGKPKLSSNALIVANVINLCLDIVYMQFMGMGIGGGALATVTGNAVGAFLYLIYVRSNCRTLHLSRLKASDFKLYKDMFKMSISSIFGQGLMFSKIWIFNMIISATAGQAGLTAFSICTSCLSFVSLFIAGGAQTMMPMVGAFSGAKDYSAIRLTMDRAFKLILKCCILVTILFELVPGVILNIYGISGGTVMETGTTAIRLFSLAFAGIGFSFMFMYYMQAMGRPAFAMQICALEGFIIIVPVCFLLANLLGEEGIWISYTVNELLTALFILLKAKSILKKSEGHLHSLYLLEEPEPPVLEFSVDVSDKAQIQKAQNCIIEHVKEHYCCRKDILQITTDFFDLARYAYQQKTGLKKGDTADIIVRNGKMYFKDMGREYAMLECGSRIEKMREMYHDYDSTLMIGMNYSSIGLERKERT